MTALLDLLGRARDHGFLGPGPLEPQVAHARGFLEPVVSCRGVLVDLGSGGGLPGLVIALERPDLEVVLLDAAARRCAFLDAAIGELGLRANTRAVHARAEDVGRGPLRAGVAAVVARSFGPPAVTAECAAPLLTVGGRLVVSEPPDGPTRWPAAPLAELGLAPTQRRRSTFAYQVLEQVAACPDRFPRRPGIPAKRPLF